MREIEMRHLISASFRPPGWERYFESIIAMTLGSGF